MVDETLPPWANRVGEAIAAEANRDTDTALRIIADLLDTYGADIAAILVTIIVDSYLHRIRGSHEILSRDSGVENPSVAPLFREDVKDTPPDVLWAGRMIAARAAWDSDTWSALFTTAAKQGRLGNGIFALLHVVGSGLRYYSTGCEMVLPGNVDVSEIPDSPEGLM